MPESAVPAYITSLIRHFEDLRDGTHGGSASRTDKQSHFEEVCNFGVGSASDLRGWSVSGANSTRN